MAKIQPEFTKRNTNLNGLSVDPVANHHRWAADIEETQSHQPKYRMRPRPERRQALQHAAG